MAKNEYTLKAKKTVVHGHKSIGKPYDAHIYDSRLEARVARLLIELKIKFTPHVKYKCFNREGAEFSYEIDFVFEEPQKLAGVHKWITCLEVKGVLSKSDLLRLDALEFSHGLHGYLCTQPLIKMWEVEGI